MRGGQRERETTSERDNECVCVCDNERGIERDNKCVCVKQRERESESQTTSE